VATQWNSATPHYAPAWAQIEGTVNGNVYPADFALQVPAEVGVVDLKARLFDGDMNKVETDTLFVTLSIRQATTLPGTPVVEVMTKVIVAYDDEWALMEITPVKVDLPVGSYTVVASFEGRTSVEMALTVTTGTNALTLSIT